jgi:serine/threonine protein phosphatase PrpC
MMNHGNVVLAGTISEPLALPVYSGSRKGGKHAENQDAIGVRQLSCERRLLVIADGIGSHAYGGSVARWIVEKRLMVDTIPESLNDYLKSLHRKFQRDFEDIDEMIESGASLSLAVVGSDSADIYWAGDSPVFHTRHNPSPSTTLIAEPHSGAGGALTKCFVGSHDFSPSHRRIDIRSGDVITLASDGFIIDESFISYEVSNNGFSQAKIDAMLEDSVASPGSDDASVICYIHVDEEER